MSMSGNVTLPIAVIALHRKGPKLVLVGGVTLVRRILDKLASKGVPTLTAGASSAAICGTLSLRGWPIAAQRSLLEGGGGRRKVHNAKTKKKHAAAAQAAALRTQAAAKSAQLVKRASSMQEEPARVVIKKDSLVEILKPLSTSEMSLTETQSKQVYDSAAHPTVDYDRVCKTRGDRDSCEVDSECMWEGWWYQSCVPRDVYADMGRFQNGPRAAAYVRAHKLGFGARLQQWTLGLGAAVAASIQAFTTYTGSALFALPTGMQANIMNIVNTLTNNAGNIPTMLGSSLGTAVGNAGLGTASSVAVGGLGVAAMMGASLMVAKFHEFILNYADVTQDTIQKLIDDLAASIIGEKAWQLKGRSYAEKVLTLIITVLAAVAMLIGTTPIAAVWTWPSFGFFIAVRLAHRLWGPPSVKNALKIFTFLTSIGEYLTNYVRSRQTAESKKDKKVPDPISERLSYLVGPAMEDRLIGRFPMNEETRVWTIGLYATKQSHSYLDLNSIGEEVASLIARRIYSKGDEWRKHVHVVDLAKTSAEYSAIDDAAKFLTNMPEITVTTSSSPARSLTLQEPGIVVVKGVMESLEAKKYADIMSLHAFCENKVGRPHNTPPFDTSIIIIPYSGQWKDVNSVKQYIMDQMTETYIGAVEAVVARIMINMYEVLANR